jgi:hypothetical protein
MSNKETIKALKTFEATWAPAITAMPAVVKALEEVDFLEDSKVKLRKDIEALQGEYLNAEKAWQEAEGQWRNRLEDLQKQIGVANAEASAAVAAAGKAQREQAKKAKDAEDAAARRASEAADKAKAEIERLDAVVAAKQAETASAVAALDIQVIEAEKKYAATLAKLEKLKLSLAG